MRKYCGERWSDYDWGCQKWCFKLNIFWYKWRWVEQLNWNDGLSTVELKLFREKWSRTKTAFWQSLHYSKGKKQHASESKDKIKADPKSKETKFKKPINKFQEVKYKSTQLNWNEQTNQINGDFFVNLRLHETPRKLVIIWLIFVALCRVVATTFKTHGFFVFFKKKTELEQCWIIQLLSSF